MNTKHRFPFRLQNARPFHSMSGPILLCLLATWGLQGCGRVKDPFERVSISGTVQVNGQPLENGRITFLPGSGVSGPVTGAQIQRGIFQIGRQQGPVVGTHRVKILGLRETGRMLPATDGSGKGDESTPMIAEIEQFLPAQYNDETTLTVDITSSKASGLTFELEAPEPSAKRVR